MLRSLLFKGVMLAAAIAVVLGIGWPVPRAKTPVLPSEQPVAAPAPVTRPLASMSSVKATSKVDLNRAGVEELQTLPGVGPVLAERMVEWRRRHGRFRTVDELREVKGIGKKRLEQLRPRVTVET